jgi:hypothetical protein
MQDNANSELPAPKWIPWNKGKLTGAKPPGCDVVALKVEDVAPNGYCADRATVRQRKTGRPVRFELMEQTRGVDNLRWRS